MFKSLPFGPRKEGQHHKFDDLEFWAEDGLIYIEDRRVGDFHVVTCQDFALRADVINEEARRAYYPDEKRNLQNVVINMHEAWKEAKNQGDPMDPEVARQRYKERRKVVLVTGW